MFTELFKLALREIGYEVTVEEVKHSIQKERRICDVLEPVMNNHKLIIDEKVIEEDFKSTQHLPIESSLDYQLIYQMTRITRERGALRRDDRLDALAIAVGYWVQQMNQDADAKIKERQTEALMAEVEKVRQAMFSGTAVVFGHIGGGNNSHKWM